MNITRDNAVKLPENGENIIATIYCRVFSVNLKTGEVLDDYEDVFLAQGYPDEDDPGRYYFRFYTKDSIFAEEWNFEEKGYWENLYVDEYYDDSGDPVQTYSLDVVTDFVVNTGMRIERVKIGKFSDTQDIYAFNSVKMEYRNSSGKVLWELSEDDE